MRKELITAPTSEPITLDEAKLFARVELDSSDTIENSLIENMITTARRACEHYTHRKYGEQTWEIILDKDEILSTMCLEIFEVNSVISVKSYDSDDVETILDSSLYDLFGSRLMVDLTDINFRSLDALKIEYVVGISAVNATVIEAMQVAIAHWYENRETAVVGTIASNLPFGFPIILSGEKIYTT